MENTKTAKIAVAFVALLLVSSTVVMLLNSAGTTTVSAVASTSDPDTGEPYGDILQYEWAHPGGDAGFTRFNPGPAPNNPSLLWTFTGSGVGTGAVSVFNGMAFTSSSNTLYALDAFTGELEYSVPLPYGVQSGSVHNIDKLSDQYMLITNSRFLLTGEGFSRGIGFEVHRISNGEFLWSTKGHIRSPPGSTTYEGSIYDPEAKMGYLISYEVNQSQPFVMGYDFSDPTQEQTAAWTYPTPEPSELLAAGDGKVFVGGYQFIIYALNGTTGELLWTAPQNWVCRLQGYLL